MSGQKKVDNLDALLNGVRPKPADGPSEARLDSLLDRHSRGDAPLAAQPAAARRDVLDRLRDLFQAELLPAADGLREKYEAKGVFTHLDAADFLRGGRRVNLTIEFAGRGLRLEGTVTTTSIAFHQTRYSKDDPAGLASSGPSLRINGLTGNEFRNFICERISALVQQAVQRSR